MATSIGSKKIRAAVFISGTGSNLHNLIKFSKKRVSPISINIIISNNTKSKGLKFADIYKIKKNIIDFKKKDLAEKKILKILKENRIDLICLAGFMKILSKKFINNFQGKILNIHPSLLPKYKGLDTHKKVIKNNEKFTGCTVHLVTEKLDSGKIILQKKIRIKKFDTVESIAKRVLTQEHKLYPEAILKLFNF